MGKHILILGGGFGGLEAASILRRDLGPEHKVTLIDRQPLFLMGLTKLWIIDGRRQVGEAPGNRTLLARRGIDFIESDVASIDAANRQVRVGKQNLACDYLIIALGADYSTNSPKGFARYATNLYTESGCAEVRDMLRSLKSGTVTILICGLPFKCPPAPYEASMIIDDVLRKNGVRDSVTLQIITPEPHPLGILGQEAGQKVTRLLQERKIGYHPQQSVVEVKPKAVVTAKGQEIPHDVLFAVPVHVAPTVLNASGLTDESGWIAVDPATLKTRYPNVFALGDCAGVRIPKGAMLPRAGILAEEQAKVVAGNIVREINGTSERVNFAGKGVCYMEAGGDKAAPVSADFFAQPNPTWEIAPPSEEGYEQKRLFLEKRMKAWFS